MADSAPTTHEVVYPHEPMHNDDGTMRMVPGWEIVEKFDTKVGKKLPYAFKSVQLTCDPNDERVLWSTSSSDSKDRPFPREVLEGRDRTPSRAHYTIDQQLLRQQTARRDSQNSIPDCPLEIWYPLFDILKVQQVCVRLVSEARGKEIMRCNRHRRRNWRFGRCDFNQDQASIVRAEDPQTQLVKLSNGRYAYPDFVETIYHTTTGSKYRASNIRERKDVGIVETDGDVYIWKLSPDCQEIQVYEAWMDKRIRLYRRQNTSQPKAALSLL